MVILKTLRRDVCLLEPKTLSLVSAALKSRLFTLSFHLLDHLIDEITRICSLSALDVLPFEHYNTSIDAVYNYKCSNVQGVWMTW